MTLETEIYKCQVCNNVIEIVRKGEGELVCCGQPMFRLTENTDDNAAQEKHVPVLQNDKIMVGSILHPMTEEHHIEFIEAISSDKKYLIRKFLKPGEEPTLSTTYDWSSDKFIMRELCNLHGLWASNKE